MRKAALATVALIAATGCAAQASAAAPDSAAEKAYTLTLMCSAVAAHYQDKAAGVRALEAARKIAASLHYGNARLAADISGTAEALGIETRTDPGAMERHRASCRGLGLAS
ncbi:hypothetical protein [Sphingomonas sp.]|uniref:hypothetical protein n=1 Tax=Sphingomonas sp. TaxID=28214 RepID=UPI001B0FB60D|nr:hypothetical protein [Sphingomonas sp.]MBO9712645.1 hypothetical protein [Sphingomonas sp.]